jgi:DNA-binding Xre family transcriptional regulator
MMHWRLDTLMAKRGIRHASHLGPALREHNITLSRAQLARLRNGQFQHIRRDLLAALCAILRCGPGELLVLPTRSTPGRRPAAPGGSAPNESGPAAPPPSTAPPRLRRRGSALPPPVRWPDEA